MAVIVVPSINLITQFLNDYLLDKNKIEYNKKYFNKTFELLTVCSKNELNNSLNFTTDEDKILDFLEKESNKIILITYQSFESFVNIIKEHEFMVDLLCFDEAHHILGNNMKKILFGLNNNENYDELDDDDYDIDNDDVNFIESFCNKTLFFTATPKNSNGIMMYESITCFDNYELIEDDESFIKDELSESVNLPDCGKMIYEYMHLNGVNDNILNDFNIRVDLYTENTDTNVFDAISRCILETGNNRILTFHSRSEMKSDRGSNVIDFVDKELFIQCFNKVRKKEFPDKSKYKNIFFKGITASTKNKLDILQEFDNTKDDEIYILASCKTIGEGVDTKHANMCVFIDPKQSYIEIIQNIGRICRKNNKTNGLATVFIPAYVDVDKYKDCKTEVEQNDVIKSEMSKTGDFNGILNVLSALRQEDPYIFELCLNSPNVYTDKEIKDVVKKVGNELEDVEYSCDEIFGEYEIKYNDDIDEKENFKVLSDKLKKNIKVVNKKIDSEDIKIGEYDETINLVKLDDDKFMKVNGKNKLERPNRNIKPTYHINDEIKVLWNITSNVDVGKNIFGGYINCSVTMSSEEEWILKLELVKKYIDENHKLPSTHDKNKEIKFLGGWLSRQQKNYKKKEQIMKNQEIYNIWTEFITEYQEYFISNETQWTDTLNKLKIYIDENNKLPSNTDKNKEIKVIGTWIGTQQKNYKKKEKIMKNQEIYNIWTEFITEYQEYFVDNETQWNYTLNKLKIYIDENHKRPSTIDKNKEIKCLGYWLSDQRKNYKKKEKIMKNQEIYNIWTEFITEYQEYFISNETQWTDTLNKLKIYIDENNKRPSENDKNKEIKVIGMWIGNQQKNYKKKEQIMKNEEIYNIWSEFITEYKQYFPNIEITHNSLSNLNSLPTVDEEYIKNFKIIPIKMSSQKSFTTKEMFNNKPDLWHEYHDSRDFSFLFSLYEPSE